MNYAAMGEKVRTARKKLHLSQEQLADAAGISASFVGHIERGTRIMSLETLFALCEALQVSADYLIGLSAETAIKPLLNDLTQEEWQIGIKLLHRLTWG